MKYSIFIEPDREEEVIIYAHEHGGLAEKIERLILDSSSKLACYRENEVLLLDISEIYAFSVVGGKVFAHTEKQKYTVRERLYMLEERFPDFLKINQSCLVCTDKIRCFGHSIGGSVTVTLKNGFSDYVSRRQLKIVKERIGF